MGKQVISFFYYCADNWVTVTRDVAGATHTNCPRPWEAWGGEAEERQYQRPGNRDNRGSRPATKYQPRPGTRNKGPRTLDKRSEARAITLFFIIPSSYIFWISLLNTRGEILFTCFVDTNCSENNLPRQDIVLSCLD